MPPAAYDDDYADAPAPERKPDRKPVLIRGAFMLFFLVAFYFSQALLGITAVIQFLSLLFTGAPNAFLADFGRALGRWLAQVSRFQSAATEDKPFPWAPWPKPE